MKALTMSYEDLIEKNAVLEKAVVDLQEQTLFYQKQIQNLQADNQNLQEQLNWLKRQLFGKKSEKFVSTAKEAQLEFDFGLPSKQELIEEEKIQQIAAHTRKIEKKQKDAFAFSEDLPIERIELDVPEEEKICQRTGEPLKKIGEEVSQKLAYKPGRYYIKKYVRPKYVSQKAPEQGVYVQEMPDSIIPKCRADESLLAHIITQKYVDHLPLYRIAEICKRDQVHISKKLLSSWVLRIGLSLYPLYQEMLKQVLDSGSIFVDESPVDLLIPGNKKVHQAYMWVYVGGGQGPPSYRVYDFCMNRKYENALKILEGYKGILHSDKYGVYEVLGKRKGIIWCPCWYHVRRKFVEAEYGDVEFREKMLLSIQKLSQLEQKGWESSAEERLRIRQEEEQEIVEEILIETKQRVEEGDLQPKSKMSRALRYAYNLSVYLKNYLQYPQARMDNNVAERAIRPLAIGRKNWLFVGSPDGGKAAATLLSLVQTCRNQQINPEEYLEDVLRRIMGHNSQKLAELLPDQWAKQKKKSLL